MSLDANAADSLTSKLNVIIHVQHNRPTPSSCVCSTEDSHQSFDVRAVENQRLLKLTKAGNQFFLSPHLQWSPLALRPNSRLFDRLGPLSLGSCLKTPLHLERQLEHSCMFPYSSVFVAGPRTGPPFVMRHSGAVAKPLSRWRPSAARYYLDSKAQAAARPSREAAAILPRTGEIAGSFPATREWARRTGTHYKRRQKKNQEQYSPPVPAGRGSRRSRA